MKKDKHPIDKARHKQYICIILVIILAFHDIPDFAPLADFIKFIALKLVALGLICYIFKLNKISRWLRP